MKKVQHRLILLLTSALITFSFLGVNALANETETTNSQTSCKLADTIKNLLGDTILDAEIVYNNEPYGITEGIEKIDACDGDFSIISKVIGQNYFNYQLALEGNNPEQFILSLLPSQSEIDDFTGDIENIVDDIDLPNALVDAGFLDDIDIKGTVEFNVPSEMNWNINSNIPTRFEFVAPDHFEIDTDIPDTITVEAELSDTTTGVITVSLIGIFIISGIALVIAIKKE